MSTRIVTICFNFQLELGFDLPEVAAALIPLAPKYGFREHGAGTWLASGVRDVGGTMPLDRVRAMDAELREKLGVRYLGHVVSGAGTPSEALR